MPKIVTVTIPDDPFQPPEASFEGTWFGRDLMIAIRTLRKSYRKYVKEQGGIYESGNSGNSAKNVSGSSAGKSRH